MWILRGRGCSQREQKWQRSHGKIVLGMLKEVTGRPVWLDVSEQVRDSKVKVNDSLIL